MKLTSGLSFWSSLFTSLVLFSSLSSAIRVIESDSLNSCSQSQNETGFSASLFKVSFTPDNASLAFSIQGSSTISGKVLFDLTVSAYGYDAFQTTINPCESGPSGSLAGACPMVPSGQLQLTSTIPNGIPRSAINSIPGITYTIPDLDGQVTIRIRPLDDPSQELTCVQAELSNGKTVYQPGVGWATAVVAGLALLTSAIVSGLGHSNTAAHVAANALSLFGFFQTQALFGCTAVHLPPIVASWTQNFQWSLGIIHIEFIQTIATWYQRATGGTPSTTLTRLQTVSVDVQKRSLVERGVETIGNAAHALAKRVNSGGSAETLHTIKVRGIERVGFTAGIESTDIFMTGFIFFLVFFVIVVLCVVAFKWILEGLARSGKMKGDNFQDFRNGWTTVLKGIMFRMVLIGFPQMVVLCFWEFTKQDSAGEIAIAVITIFTMLGLLGFVCFKIVRIARRSIVMHKNPAYILYSDPVCLHKWGFLYVQFKAASYWFIIPILGYNLVLGMFVAFGQTDYVAQGIGFLILTAGLLIAVSILRPYMDKRTNAFNIAIAAVNFLSAIFLLFFTEVFGVPPLVIGVMGVIFFLLNAIFALVLIILVLIATGYAIFSKNPDVRYQPMRDDRGSFIKSQSNLNTELDALGATARGESKVPYKTTIDDDHESAGSWENGQQGYHGVAAPYNKDNNMSYESTAYTMHDRSMSMRSDTSRQRNNASPWQRGAGYER